MATPSRRSSRTRSGQATPSSNLPATPSRLMPLLEREETPGNGTQQNIDAVASPGVGVKTPTAASAIKASSQEMHPSLFQTSAKKLASEQRFGFTGHSVTSTPTKQISSAPEPQTAPAKTNTGTGTADNPFTSPSFEFRFKRPSSELSTEAQRLMEDVREQAARIKVELAAQRDEQLRKDGEADASLSRRKLATPKSKIGRFSDVHLEQFKKMGSIADHPSSFRADSSRPSSPKKSLKRSNSKAELDKVEASPSPMKKNLKRSNSQISLKKPGASTASPLKSNKTVSNAAEIVQSAAKPAKQLDGSSRAVAGDAGTPSKIPASRSTVALASPSKQMPTPPITRDKTAKVAKHKTGIPKTPSKPSIFKPVSMPQTDPSNKRRSTLSEKLSSVKSILRKPSVRFSNDPLKQAAGTHHALPTPTKGLDGLRAPALSVEESMANDEMRHEKSVSFSPIPQVFGNSLNKEPASPSPAKKKQISYPKLSSESSRRAASPTAGSNDFTFRVGQSISFAHPGKEPSTPSVRKVAAGGLRAVSDPPSGRLADLPNVPHGLSNKKRKRLSAEGGTEDKENEDGSVLDTQEHQQSPSKRVKTSKASPVKMPGTVKADSAAKKSKKSVLSLSRLQELARPKARK